MTADVTAVDRFDVCYVVAGRAEVPDDRVEVAGQVRARAERARRRSPHRTAPLVPEHDDQRGAVFQRAVLDRGRDQAIDHMRTGADALVKDGLGSNPRVDAGHDRGKRILTGRHLLASRDVLVGVGEVPLGPAPVPGLKPGPCLGRRQPLIAHVSCYIARPAAVASPGLSLVCHGAGRLAVDVIIILLRHVVSNARPHRRGHTGSWRD
jgi:hypothetical protein